MHVTLTGCSFRENYALLYKFGKLTRGFDVAFAYKFFYNCRYRARYRYAPQNEDELELQEGDIVKVMEQCDDGWYVGMSERSNEFGTFPGNYVQPTWLVFSLYLFM